ncbi:recombinase family protein [Legionella sp. CNM-1927-20]|uniref:recombinase family protein n=1 Tax=Legionella sp. CNM-1927-20 TaxID=3422221 RepID=UPI00403AF9D7
MIGLFLVMKSPWFTKNEVKVEFIKEKLTFSSDNSPREILLLSVMGAFAEFERALIKERQREGIELAKKRGAYAGRKKVLTAEQALSLKERINAREKKVALARELGISRETLYQYLRLGSS